MRRMFLTVMLFIARGVLHAQARIPTPDECYGFKFGGWSPPLKSVASTYNPGYDPTTSAPAGSPRDWAARVATGRASAVAPDSVLLLFPAWWPAGVSIEWLEQRGDTLLGRAVALVADGRVKNPVSTVRGVRVACRRSESPPDTSRRGP
ncbi:MAG: hypothetical protein ACJ796_04590 [Gemmatimonadaceae bacterium]